MDTGDLPGGKSWNLQAEPAPPQNNLPHPVSRFIGRERELSEIQRLMTRSRLVSLTGPGGSGKTRLAIEVAHQALPRFSDGVWIIDLLPLREPNLVLPTIASVLGVREEASRPLIQAVGDYLRSRSILLLFDNCEHLVAVCAEVADLLLQFSPELHILATSREPLRVAGESQFLVPTLTLPPPEGQVSIDEMKKSEAVRVFLDRAAMARSTFELTEDNAPVIAQICRRLDGIPLAVELAAARVKALNVEQIAARLDDRFRLLNAGNRSGLPRHQTLRATLDWSHNLLSEDERVLLRRLCVFADSWNLDAASAVCAMGQLKERDILELLVNLADKSLVSVDGQDSKARYRFLESIREYAREKLDEAGEDSEIQDRHVEFFQGLAARAEDKFRGSDQLLWLNVMEAERDNLRAAIEYALRSPARSASELVGTAFWLWFFRGPWSEGQLWAEAALAQGTVGITPSKARVLLALGLLQFEQSDYAAAKGSLEKSLGIWRQLEDKWWSAFVLDFLGLIIRAKDEDAASRMFSESVELATATGEKWILAFSLWNMGENELHQKNLPEARRLLQASLTQTEALGDRLLQNELLRALGEIAEAGQDYAQAVSLYEQSLVIIREFRDTTNISVLHYNLGRALQLKGENDKAANHFKEAMQWSQRLGKRAGTLRALAGLGVVSAAAGEAHKAVCLLVASEALFGTLGISSSFNPAPHQSGWLERHLETARKKLGEAGYSTAKAEGEAMTLDRAVQYALE